jgi:hypothetical protein
MFLTLVMMESLALMILAMHPLVFAFILSILLAVLLVKLIPIAIYGQLLLILLIIANKLHAIKPKDIVLLKNFLMSQNVLLNNALKSALLLNVKHSLALMIKPKMSFALLMT